MALVLAFLCLVCQVSAAKNVENINFAVKERVQRSKYSFAIHSVERCPMNAQEWDSSSQRLKCNNTHGYHCLPQETLSSLVEFCYPLGDWIQIPKGNCPRLGVSNRLKFHKCNDFKCGCPEQNYYNNEIYKYPACLRIFEKCFIPDITFIKGGYSNTERRPITTPPIWTEAEQRRNGECKCTVYIALFSIALVMFIASVVVNILYCCKDRQRREVPLQDIYKSIPSDEVRMVEVRDDKVKDSSFVDDIDRYLLVDYTIENVEVFKLLKIQCLNGVHIGFHYVNKSRVIEKNLSSIFHQRDEKGCTLLHYAAQGGSILIFKEILKTDLDINIGVKCFSGQTALHFAIRYKQKDMSEYLITEHKEHFTVSSRDPLSLSEHKGREETAIISIITGQFEPFHWIAWNGDTWLHHFWKEANLNVKGLTKNGLNVLDVACISNQFEFCRHIIDNEKEINIEKVDASGWNVAHYAAMWNNVKLLKLLAEKKKPLIMALTKSKKTTLHIASEHGHFDVAKHLTETEGYESLLHSTDNLKWNALHFAAKGGNMQVFELLLRRGLKINSLTVDNKTLLHIATIYKQVDMCKYIARTFSQYHKELMNQRTTNQGWSAAHYVSVEKKELRGKKEIIDILHQYGMNLKERTSQGVSILDVAIVYLDIELIKLIVSDVYREILDINKEVILNGKKHTDDKIILKILDNALEEISAAS